VAIKSRAVLTNSLTHSSPQTSNAEGMRRSPAGGLRTPKTPASVSDRESFAFGGRPFMTDRETILVVSHEASRTGAPVLSLNLVQALGSGTTL